MQSRSKKGTFAHKSSSDRQVKSIRATEGTWKQFGEEAEELGITRADLLEQTYPGNGVIPSKEVSQVLHGRATELLGILKHGVTSKKQGGAYATNNAKSLKEEVLKAIAILEAITE